MQWRAGSSTYHITVANPEHRSRGVGSVHLDGRPVDPGAIPLAEDGVVHEVTAILHPVAAGADRAIASSLRP